MAPADVLRLLRELIAIPSVNPSLDPDGAGEGDIATFARDWLAARGVAAHLEEAAPGRPNVFAEVPGPVGDGPVLCLYAHLDTVATTGVEGDPFGAVVEGDRVYGRGGYDMKGGAAAVMAAAADLAAGGGPARGRVILALVADEEYRSIGADDYVRRHRADGCIVTEPTDGKLVLGHKGFVWCDVTTRGRAAHGSRWDIGESAIAKMGPVIVALDRFDREVLRARRQALVGPASMHAAVIEGGSGVSTYAAECHLQVERRLIPGETAEAAAREIEEVVGSADPEASCKVYFSRPPLLCDPAAEVVDAVRGAIEHVTERGPEETGTAGWLDSAIFAAAGIPTVIYGPTGAGAHEAVEWVDLDSVVTLTRVLGTAVRGFCR